jgi:DNA-binding GntR family transcriptional regulator
MTTIGEPDGAGVASLRRELPIFRLAEEQVVFRAAGAIDEAVRGRLKHAMDFLRRCSQVGDTDGMLAADARIERIICEAAGEPAAAAELQAMKLRFKQAWRDSNRLRDTAPDTRHRDMLVARIVAGDAEGAVAAVRAFYADVGGRL